MRIALPDFVADSSIDAEVAHAIAQAIASDLELTDIFVLAYSERLAGKRIGVSETPLFAEWRFSNIDQFVSGSLTREPDGRIKVAFRLWEAFAERQLASHQYIGTHEQMEEIGHMISANIYDNVVRRWPK